MNGNVKKKRTLRLTYAALCLALTVVLPFVTGNNLALGNMLSLIHLPVLLCGLICGPGYGAAVGLVAPFLRFLIVSRPPLLNAIPMAPELLVYGLVTGILYRVFPKKAVWIFPSMLIAMLLGRIAGGTVKLLLLGLGYLDSYSFTTFLTAYFVTSLPGIALQLVVIPLIVLALKKGKFLPDD